MKVELNKHFWLGVLVTLCSISVILVAWFFIDIRSLYETGALRPSRDFHRDHLPIQHLNTNQIQSWMTFAYINQVFNLPPDYLAQVLDITDQSYPNMSLNRYITDNNLNETEVLTMVQDTVAGYLQSNP